MSAQTSDRVSSLAARYMKIELADLAAAVANERVGGRMVAEIRALAASVLAQDEAKGLRKLAKRMKEMLR